MSHPRPTKKKSLTPPEDKELNQIAATAEKAREETWRADKEREWNGTLLKPWSREREAIFIRLKDLDEAASGLDMIPLLVGRLAEKGGELSIEAVLDPHQFIEQASLVLYLASHDPEAWDALRGRPAAFLRAANAWAEKNIPLGHEWPAINLAVTLRTAHQQMVAIRRPTAHSGGSEGK